MVNKKYKAFTLVEMLIVMGILSVLMAIGVSVARFAIQRANNIQHQSAADQMYQALQSHYADKRKYPTVAEFGDFDAALDGTTTPAGVLSRYVDASFDGGAPAALYYVTDGGTAPQAMLVCVSFAQPTANTATENLGGYCNGNGFGDGSVAGGNITKKTYEPGDDWWDNGMTHITSGTAGTDYATSNWDGEAWE